MRRNWRARSVDARLGQPLFGDPRDPVPSRVVPMAAPLERAAPEGDDTGPEQGQGRMVRRHGVIGKIAARHLPQPSALARDRVVHPPAQLGLDRPFAPPPPQPARRLRSGASQLLWRSLTSPVRASSATAPRLPDADQAALCGLWSGGRSPGSRARGFRTSQGLRPRRVGRGLALARTVVWPSGLWTPSAPGTSSLRGSMAGLCAPLPTLRP